MGMGLFKITSLRNWFLVQRWRFNKGQSYIAFVNFALLVVTASSKIGLNSKAEVFGFVSLVIFAVWFIGYFLDVVVKEQANMERVEASKGMMWNEVLGKLDAILKNLEDK